MSSTPRGIEDLIAGFRNFAPGPLQPAAQAMAPAVNQAYSDRMTAQVPPVERDRGPTQQDRFMELVNYVTSKYPGVSPEFMQSILGGEAASIAANREERQATNQAALGGLNELLLGAATQGAPPETIEALTASYTAANPVLERPKFAGRVEDITSGASGVSSSLMPQGGTLDAEDLGVIEQAIGSIDPSQTQPGDGTHDQLLQGIIDRMRTSGAYTPEQLQAAEDYFNRVWVRAGGPPPAGTVAPTEPSGPGIGATIMGGLTSGLANIASPFTAVPRYGLEALLSNRTSPVEGLGNTLAQNPDLAARLQALQRR